MLRTFLIPIILVCLSLSVFAQKNNEAIKAYNSGVELFKLQNYQGAIDFMKEAIAADPGFIHAHRTLISAHEQLKQLDKAIQAYLELVKILPSDEKLHFNLALTYRDNQQQELAMKYLEKALAINPGYEKAALELKRLKALSAPKQETTNIAQAPPRPAEVAYSEALDFYNQKKYSKTIRRLRENEEGAETADYFYLMAIAQQQIGEREEAKASYQAALEIDDLHFDASYSLGKLLFNDEAFKEALPYLETAQSREPNHKRLRQVLAKAYFYAGKYRKAIPILEAMPQEEYQYLLAKAYDETGQGKKSEKIYAQLQGNSKNSHLAEQLRDQSIEYGREASKYARDGDYNKAIETLEKAITINSGEASLHFNLGLNYLEVGNPKKARNAFKKATEINPNHGKAFAGLGHIYYEKEEYPDAAAYYLAAIDAGLKDIAVQAQLGASYLRLFQPKKAIEAYQGAIDLAPGDPYNYFNLGRAYMEAKEHPLAIKAFEEALSLDNMFLDAHYNIAICYIEINDYQKGLEVANAIIAKDDEYALGYLAKAACYKRMRKYDKAEEFEKIALRLDPSLKGKT